MTAERMAQYMEAMRAHFAKHGGKPTHFIHGVNCPAFNGGNPLDQCLCDPTLDIDGKVYKLQVSAQLVPVKP